MTLFGENAKTLFSGIFMSGWDAVISFKKLHGWLLIVTVLSVSSPMVLAQETGADPFNGSDNKEEYPSVLTMPNFEASVTNTAPSNPVPPAVKPATSLKTPIQPATTVGVAENKSYITPAPVVTYSSHALILREDVLLSQGINEWAKASGYKMLWNSTRDYLIYSTITLSGTTQDDVLGELGKLFASENYGLVIKLYEKNRVLLVDEQ